MTVLNGRRIDEFGNVIFTEQGLCNCLMLGTEISELLAESSEAVELFNTLCKQWDHPQDSLTIYKHPNEDLLTYHNKRQDKWLIPSEYKNFDVQDWLLSRCITDEQITRVIEELELFEQRNMIPVLVFLNYLVQFMREHQIVWGVGRGSSVASYCLFLMGVHKIDSLKYSLDIKEFLK
jgi:DNA polymerase III alpha subunit